MARLDEQFLFAAEEPQQRTMRRLVATLELRLSALERQRADYENAIKRVEDVALRRINDVLLPASERIQSYTTLGFLVIHSDSENTLVEGQQRLFIANEGPQRDLFTPTPFVTIQRRLEEGKDDFAIAVVNTYHSASGSLLVRIVAAYGEAGPFNDWVISASPGISIATRRYYERTMTFASTFEEQTQQAAADRAFVATVRQQLEGAGLNPDAYVWRDGSRPFTHVIRGITPQNVANDTALATTAWTRARITEIVQQAIGTVKPTTVTVSANPPANPAQGDLWWFKTGAQLYVSIDNAWIIAVNQLGGRAGEEDEEPEPPPIPVEEDARKLLNSIDVINAPYIEDVTSFLQNPSYDQYEIEFLNLRAVTAPAQWLRFQVHSGGELRETPYFVYSHIAANTAHQNNVNLTFIALNANRTNQHFMPGASGLLRIFNPHLADRPKTCVFSASGQPAAITSQPDVIQGSGFWNNTAPVEGFRLSFSDNNITGHVKVYGVE